MGRIYYGWWILAIAMTIYMLVIGTTFGAFGLFVVPVSTELKLSRAEMNTALIVMNLGNACVAPMLGRVLDKIPVRRVFFACALALGLGLALLGLSRSIWLSAAVMAVLMPVGYLGSGTLTMSVLIARWFTAQRGRAMALAGIGMALGNITVTPLVGLLIEAQGWRTTLMVVGAALAVLLSLLCLLLRERPGPGDVETGGSQTLAAAQPPQPAAPAGVWTILRSPQFWSISLSAALALGVIQTITITVVPLGLQSGLSMIQATTLMSAFGAGSIGGALLLSLFADKVDRIMLLTGVLLAGALLNAALSFAATFTALLACAGLLGVVSGALPPVIFALLADRFGPASFGTVRGLTMPVLAGAGMIAVRFAGEVFDRTGGYDVMFHAFVVAQLVAAVLMFATRFTRPLAPAAAPAV